jgi:hypothetical protein
MQTKKILRYKILPCSCAWVVWRLGNSGCAVPVVGGPACSTIWFEDTATCTFTLNIKYNLYEKFVTDKKAFCGN